MLFAIALATVVAAPYDPRNVVIEHCVQIDAAPHCLLEQIDSGRLRLLLTPAEKTVFMATPLGETIAKQEHEVVSDDRYFDMRRDSFGAYLFEPDASGGVQITPVGFPHDFAALKGDPRLGASDNGRCQAGVFGTSMAMGAAAAYAAFQGFGGIGNVPVSAGGAVVGFALGSAVGAAKGWADYCTHDTCEPKEKAAVSKDPAPAPTAPQEDPAPQPPPAPPAEPETSSDSIPLPDAVSSSGIVAPHSTAPTLPPTRAGTLVNPRDIHTHLAPPLPMPPRGLPGVRGGR